MPLQLRVIVKSFKSGSSIGLNAPPHTSLPPINPFFSGLPLRRRWSPANSSALPRSPYLCPPRAMKRKLW